MKVGFIGLGRMGHGMASRILGGGHDLVIYDLVPALLEDLGAAGATVAGSLAEVTADRDVVISMLPHDEALEALVFSPGGLLECLPAGAIHMVSGTHSVQVIRRLTGAHAEAGQTLVAGHVLGRPDLAAEGLLTLVPGGPPEALQRLQAGQASLAVSPLCGTNIVVTAALAALGATLMLAFGRGGQRLPNAFLAAMACAVAGQPGGRIVQRHLTTLADHGEVEIVGTHSLFGRMHKVETRRTPGASTQGGVPRLVRRVAALWPWR